MRRYEGSRFVTSELTDFQEIDHIFPILLFYLVASFDLTGKSSWPNLKTLLLLRLWLLIFPCSDFRHVVATPMLLLMCEYLMRCPIQCGRDVAVGSFLCSMVLAVCSLYLLQPSVLSSFVSGRVNCLKSMNDLLSFPFSINHVLKFSGCD
jgi:hypothetical protein